MIRALTATDLLRLALRRGPQGSDWAHRGGERGRASLVWTLPALVQERLLLRYSGATWVSAQRTRIMALASARARAGPTSWGVEHLVVPQDQEEQCLPLLEEMARRAGQAGAERLFLLLPEESPLEPVARHAGFLLCTRFLFYAGASAHHSWPPPARGLRRRKRQDDHHLFRLYNSGTPPEVRSGLGLTVQQWKDAQERTTRSRDLVLEEGGAIKAWLRLTRRGKALRAELMADPALADEVPALVGLARIQARAAPLLWQVSEFQGPLRLTLESRGLLPTRSSRLLVKPLAVRVKKPRLVPANI